jgi:ATP-dependent RNA helicase DHX8/PRP22
LFQAAKKLATRVAEEQGVVVGSEVGYKYRCCDMTSNKTLIKYCTDGTLTRECLNANLLDNYSVIILDEAHERKVDTDVLLGYLKKKALKRPKLKVIVSSATLDAMKFSKFFNNAPVFHIEGRAFPVEIFYRPTPITDYFNAALATIEYINTTQPSGDILVFLTGREEIENACDVLSQHPKEFPNVEIVPIYSTLDNIEQEKAFMNAPPGKRKIVISTNLAETSMTIPGIKYVIDTGYTKTKIYDTKSGVEILTILPTSQASADQV